MWKCGAVSDGRVFIVVFKEIKHLVWTPVWAWECLCIFGKSSQLK